jgi:dihydroorotase
MTWTTRDRLLLKGGTVVTAAGREPRDISIRDGVIECVGSDLPETGGTHVEDVSGLLLTPGFVDVHVHLRDPGAPDSETLESGLEAAAAGGVHHLFCMANTDPVNDDPELTASLVARARAASPLTLHPVAAVTRGLAGSELTDFEALKEAGAGALSNDGLPIEETATLTRALERAGETGLTILVHAEDRRLAAGGAVDARVAERLAARGIPVEAEDLATARDVAAAEAAGAPLHVCHVSPAGAVEVVRQARRRGASITAEATPHHLFLSYLDIPVGDTDFKMNPPLRAPADVAALLTGLCDGTITAIATDHAPHAPARKATTLDEAPFGAIGLETSFAVSHSALVVTGRLSLERLVALYVDGPAAIVGLDAPRIAPGARAEINLFDPSAAWQVDPAGLRSRSRNCPFKGRRLQGRIVGLVAGRCVRRYPG